MIPVMPVFMKCVSVCGHGDVRVYKKQEYADMLKQAGFKKMTIQAEKKMRCHVTAIKNNVLASATVSAWKTATAF